MSAAGGPDLSHPVEDRAMADEWMFHSAPKPLPRQPQPGEEVWRLRDPADGRHRAIRADCNG
jgi:hypothetical protein